MAYPIIADPEYLFTVCLACRRLPYRVQVGKSMIGIFCYDDSLQRVHYGVCAEQYIRSTTKSRMIQATTRCDRVYMVSITAPSHSHSACWAIFPAGLRFTVLRPLDVIRVFTILRLLTVLSLRRLRFLGWTSLRIPRLP